MSYPSLEAYLLSARERAFIGVVFAELFLLWIQVQLKMGTYGPSFGMGRSMSHLYPSATWGNKTLQCPFICKMGNCGRKFKYKFNLYKHQRSRHGAPLHKARPVWN